MTGVSSPLPLSIKCSPAQCCYSNTFLYIKLQCFLDESKSDINLKNPGFFSKSTTLTIRRHLNTFDLY